MTTTFIRSALTAALLLGASSIAVQAADKPKLSAEVGRQLSAAQTAIKNKDYQGALADIQKAQQVADATDYDKLWIDKFMMSVEINLKDFNAADTAAEAAADIDPSKIPDDEKAGIYKPALQLAMNSKHFDKAAKYAKLYLALTPPPPPEDQALATRAFFFAGDYAEATQLAQKQIAAAEAAGHRPSADDLEIVMNSQVKQKDEAGAEKTLEQLVANYGRPEDWSQILGVAIGTKGMRDIDYVYVARLMQLVGVKPSAQDASLLGNVASKQGLYGDAVLEEQNGGTGYPSPDAKAASDKKSMPAQIAAGAKQGGQYNVKLAEALYGYGMYPEAETAAKLAQSQGGAQDPTEPQMVIGMSQAAQGQYADAATTFSQINQPDPASARLVRLWEDYAKLKANPVPQGSASAQ